MQQAPAIDDEHEHSTSSISPKLAVADPFDESLWSKDDKAYYRTLDECLAKRRKFTFANTVPAHVAHVVKRLIQHAKFDVCLFTGCLPAQFNGVALYGATEVVRATKEFVGRGGRLRIVVRERDVDMGIEHPLLKAIVPDECQHEGQVLLYRASEPALKQLCDKDFDYNFIATDNAMWRIDYTSEQRSPNWLSRMMGLAQFGPRACFNDREGANALRSVFDYVFVEQGTFIRSVP